MITPQYSRLRVSQTAATVTSFATSAPSERGGGRAAALNVAAWLMIEAMGFLRPNGRAPTRYIGKRTDSAVGIRASGSEVLTSLRSERRVEGQVRVKDDHLARLRHRMECGMRAEKLDNLGLQEESRPSSALGIVQMSRWKAPQRSRRGGLRSKRGSANEPSQEARRGPKSDLARPRRGVAHWNVMVCAAAFRNLHDVETNEQRERD